MIYIILACVIFIACILWLRASIQRVAEALMRVATTVDKQFDTVWKHFDKLEEKEEMQTRHKNHKQEFDPNYVDPSWRSEPEYKERELDLADKPTDPKKKTVLYIDDDKFLLDLYGGILRKNGYNAFLRDQMKKDFISEIACLKPDLILCDVMRPDPNGFKIIKAVKADDRTKNIPFAFYSNSIDPEVHEISKKLGAFEPILKAGIPKHEMLAKIADILASASHSEK